MQIERVEEGIRVKREICCNLDDFSKKKKYGDFVEVEKLSNNFFFLEDL